jgi:hypothetical protein
MSKRRWLLSLTTAAAMTLGGALAAQATLMRALALPELVADADRIVVADVLSVQAAWDGSHRNIHTTVEIGVRESWKGLPSKDGRIMIRQLGGVVGEIEMSVQGAAKFSVGERTLLFLHGAHVVGMSQGKRNLRWEMAGRRWLAAPSAHGSTIRLDAQGKLRAAEPEPVEELDTLRAKVRALIGS